VPLLACPAVLYREFSHSLLDKPAVAHFFNRLLDAPIIANGESLFARRLFDLADNGRCQAFAGQPLAGRNSFSATADDDDMSEGAPKHSKVP
jgi:hypothetical protein